MKPAEQRIRQRLCKLEYQSKFDPSKGRLAWDLAEQWTVERMAEEMTEFIDADIVKRIAEGL